jgi:hypothetical protein
MKTMLVLLFALGSLSTPALALPGPANLYACKGDDVDVIYSTSSFIGVPMINFQFHDTTVISRSGHDISVQDTVLGSLVTVVLRTVPDLFTDTLTLIAPAAHLTNGRLKETFITRLFKTRTRTSRGGPALVEGLIQRSHSQRLVCTAQAVHF